MLEGFAIAVRVVGPYARVCGRARCVGLWAHVGTRCATLLATAAHLVARGGAHSCATARTVRPTSRTTRVTLDAHRRAPRCATDAGPVDSAGRKTLAPGHGPSCTARPGPHQLCSAREPLRSRSVGLLAELGVRGLVHHAVELRLAGHLDLGHPALVHRGLVDHPGVVRERLVHLDHLARHGGVHVRGGLDALHDAHGILLVERLSNLWQLHVHDVAELLSGKLRDPHGRHAALGLDVLVVGCVFDGRHVPAEDRDAHAARGDAETGASDERHQWRCDRQAEKVAITRRDQ
mmetsp:Transcript_3909/g.13098  ORF Transcript_3909/g.13098 Transcript_3909/m.13098 type:complete len:291 (-) Transcript_3909:58-930(-)